MDENIESILATVNFIKDRMLTKGEAATKDDLQQFERRLDARFDTLESRVGNIETELRDIRQRLEALDEAAGNAAGFAVSSPLVFGNAQCGGRDMLAGGRDGAFAGDGVLQELKGAIVCRPLCPDMSAAFGFPKVGR